MNKLTAEEYRKAATETAKNLWGEEAMKARNHIETTAEATYRISETPLTPMQEPAIKLRHGENHETI